MNQVLPLLADPALLRATRSRFPRLSGAARACVLLGLLCSATGCASLVSGPHREVMLRSKPDGAKVTIVNAEGMTVAEGVTPFAARLRKGKAYFAGQHYTLTFSKEGFCETQQVVESTVSGWYFGNLLFGGPIGLLVVDPHTGSMYTLPKEVSAQLTRPAVAMAQPGASGELDEAGGVDELHAVRLQDVPAALRGQLIQINY